MSRADSQKTKHWKKYRALSLRPMPPKCPTSSVEEAFRFGLRMGYGEGLVQGASLGVELFLGASSLVSDSVPFDIN